MKAKKPYDKPRILHRAERHLWNTAVRQLTSCFYDDMIGIMSRSSLDARAAVGYVESNDDLEGIERRIEQRNRKAGRTRYYEAVHFRRGSKDIVQSALDEETRNREWKRFKAREKKRRQRARARLAG